MKWFIVWVCLGPSTCLGPGVGVSELEFPTQDMCKDALPLNEKKDYTSFCAVYGSGDPA